MEDKKIYWETNYSHEEIKELFEIDVKNYITSYYKQCSSHDNKINNKKLILKKKYLDNLVIAGLFLAITSIPFFLKYNFTDPSIQMIEIVKEEPVIFKQEESFLEKNLSQCIKLKIKNDKIKENFLKGLKK